MNPPGPPIEVLFPDVSPLGGEIGRYHVESRSGPHPHLVDLFEHAFNGACTCEHFKFRLEPSLTRRGVPTNNSCKCHHIRRAESHFAETMKRALWAQANRCQPKAAPWPEPTLARTNL